VRRTSLAVLCSSLPRPPSSTLFPYTTLFRSPRATRSTTRSRSRPTSPRWCATRSRRERWRAGDPQQVVEQRGRGDPGPGPGTLQDERLLAVAVAPDRAAVGGATAVRQRVAGRPRLQSRARFGGAGGAAG